MSVILPTNFANAVTPFVQAGRQPVGEENTESKGTPFKSVEESAESARIGNRRGPEGRPNEVEEQVRLSGRAGDVEQKNKEALSKNQQQREIDLQREQEELLQIKDLAARDREVRAHEAAHAAVGGPHAGSPTFQFTRGPDGVSYAVSGEVSISTSSVPGDPEATIAKARQIKAAANAPADPSPQDRRVAAAASQMEAQAVAELIEKNNNEAIQAEALREGEAVEARERDEQLEEERRAAEKTEQERQQEFSISDDAVTKKALAKEADEINQSNFEFNRRLIDIGVIPSDIQPGSFFDQRV